ncbi:hypothetical protein WAK64_03820 [Bacillus spongiae]|uniref:RNA polymerase subunit sigma n=1 Tax=Bacillus spongiae TaxID=2683610 RepID=A0ABU8HAL9_9BACI
MSLKAIELQIALPKTFEAGKMTDQFQQQGQIIQSQLQAENEKKQLQKRKKVNENHPTENQVIHDESPKNDQNETSLSEMRTSMAVHPYKGHQIDFSG